MSEWSDLPNAVHIDRVLASLKKHPEIWGAARDAAWDAAYGAARDAVRGAAWNAARNAAWNAARNAGRSVPWHSARGAILALIAYDDCDQYLNMTSEELKVWAILSEHPAAVLLLSAVVAFERIRELEQLDKELF
jgi:hypothetical protein